MITHNPAPRARGQSYSSTVACVVVAAILFAPSAWMLAKIPPLWKDVDAYAQVTAPPGTSTILLFGPVYCFLARVPLFAGDVLECWRTGTSLPAFSFFAQPTLTDTGVFLLVALQHAALSAAACFLIFSMSRSFRVRLVLAMLWAANPIFYAWANCVGTETLSLILVLVLSTLGLLLVRQAGAVPLRRWLLFAFVFLLSMLTRHINGLLGAILPISFAITAGALFISDRPRAIRAIQNAAVAIILGVLAIAISHGTLRLLSRAAGIRYHSTAGFTFMFRLGFLGPLTRAERAPVIAHAGEVSKSADVRTLLSAFENAPPQVEKLDVMTTLANARALWLPAAKPSDDHFFDLMNDTARAFIVSPPRAYLEAARVDFIRSQNMNVGSLTASPVRHTMYFFDHRDAMPGAANLRTFRGRDAADIDSLLGKHRYLRAWKEVSHREALLAWFVTLLLLVIVTRGRAVAVCAYTISLTLIGILMMAANSLLNEYQARYTLPMWELTIVSITMLFGTLAESLREMREAGKSAGRLVSQVKLPGGSSPLPPESR